MDGEDRALHVAADAARAVGALLRGARPEQKRASTKAHRNDPVTVFDRKAEDILVGTIRAQFPTDGILSEEGASWAGTSGYRWVIDPLDGTNNFLRGYSHFAVSIGILRGDEPRIACIYDPLRDELFTAQASKGAHLNGEPIVVSEHTGVDGALLGVGLSSRPERAERTLDTARGLLPRVRALRTGGCACLDLAYVACGRLDATWYASLALWDIAAGLLLVREAGGRISDLAGGPLADPQTGILASNGWLHDSLSAVVRTDDRREDQDG